MDAREPIDLPEPEDLLPSRGLLSFYDRLRARILDTAERRGGKWSAGTAEALLVVPDVFMLLVRLAMDSDVPRSTRMLVSGTLAYFVMPADLLPEALLGAGGFADDLVVAVAVLSQAFGRELEPYAEKYWSGRKDLRVVLRDVLGAAEALVGYKPYERLRGLLARRGVDLERAQSA